MMLSKALMGSYYEMVNVHYPHLFRYVVLLAHEDADTGSESMGSGVLIGLGGHHYIATAAHCIKRNPRIMRDDKFYVTTSNKLATSRPIKVIRTWLHASLDIGCLEIGEMVGTEMTQDQLCPNTTMDGYMSVIGYPTCRNEVNEPRKELTVMKSVFGSTLIGRSDYSLKLDYPKTGVRVKDGQWIEEPFIATPHGFSGGGCFGVVGGQTDLQVISYKLVGIQCAWHRTEPWVEVVPIRHWLEGVKAAAV